MLGKTENKMAVRWLRKMKLVDEQLYKRAMALNKRDNFIMYDIAKRNNMSWPYSESSSSSSSSTSLSNYDFDYSDIDGEEISYNKEAINEKEVKL